MRELEEDFEIPKFIPNVLRPSDLTDVEVEPSFLEQVSSLLPPEDILDMEQFTKPEIILPDRYPDFASLLTQRDRIRRLELLPIKTPEDRVWYHSQPKEQLSRQVEGYLGPESLALAPNLFPDYLPGDLGQFLIWTKKWETTQKDIARFVSKAMRVLDLGTDEVIMFERSRATRQSIVRGTFSDYRHIHFWKKL